MIVARIMGTRRVAAGTRPSFAGAWGLVVIDMTVWFLVSGGLYPILDGQVVEGNVGAWIFVLFYFFIPLVVLSGGCIWARRTRKLTK